MMEFKYEIKDKSAVTTREQEQIESLRFTDGFIWPAFNNEDCPGFAILCKDNDKIVGWGFCFLRDGNKFRTFYLYINKNYRRLGIGSRIYQMAYLFNDKEKLNISKWSNGAANFYHSVGR